MCTTNVTLYSYILGTLQGLTGGSTGGRPQALPQAAAPRQAGCDAEHGERTGNRISGGKRRIGDTCVIARKAGDRGEDRSETGSLLVNRNIFASREKPECSSAELANEDFRGCRAIPLKFVSIRLTARRKKAGNCVSKAPAIVRSADPCKIVCRKCCWSNVGGCECPRGKLISCVSCERPVPSGDRRRGDGELDHACQ